MDQTSEVDFLRSKLSDIAMSEKIHGPELLIREASRWLGLTESGGDNRGQVVELFQKHAGIQPGSPWCMAFVQFCVDEVESVLSTLIGSDSFQKSPMGKGGHCMTVWNATPDNLKSQIPSAGAIVIWKKTGTDEGHTGIVTEALSSGNFKTIEGNSAPAGLNRNGDGIYSHEQMRTPLSRSLELVGFICPWGIS